MNYQTLIESLKSIVQMDYHFSNYEIKNLTPERKVLITREYIHFIDNLIEKLYLNYSKEELNDFIQQYVREINSELYFKNEFEILMMKFNEISYWIIGNSFPVDFYNQNSNLITFQTN